MFYSTAKEVTKGINVDLVVKCKFLKLDPLIYYHAVLHYQRNELDMLQWQAAASWTINQMNN